MTSEPLHVGYVLKMFPRFSETFIVNEMLELQARGVRITVFSMKPPDGGIQQPQVNAFGGQVYVIPALRGAGLLRHAVAHLSLFARHPGRYVSCFHFVSGRRTSAAWMKFIAAPWIVRRAESLGIEHFHAHFASGPARQAKLVSMLSGKPFSFTAHAKDLFWSGHQHGKNNKLKKRVRMAAFVVVISEFNRQFLGTLGFRVPRRRVVTVYNGLRLRHWPFRDPDGLPAGPGDEPPMILAVGRLVTKKGFGVLLDACARLRRRRATTQSAATSDRTPAWIRWRCRQPPVEPARPPAKH